MFDAKITRKEFLKMGFLGVLAFLVLPILRLFNKTNNVSHREARHYKNLAG